MISAATTLLTAACFAGAALAIPTARHENCDPAQQLFNLTVTSISGGKYSNSPLSASHTGAGVEQLAVLPGSTYGTSFTFNQTDITPSTGFCGVGYLQYLQPASPHYIQQQLQFVQNSTSNVEPAFFGEGNGPVLLTIANNGEVFYYDGEGAADTYWYICPISQLGYNYHTLSHVNDGTKPDNDGCDQVTVEQIHLP